MTTTLLTAVVEALGWTLIHFIWQATAISLVVWICLAAVQKGSAQLRYALCSIALILMVASSMVTFWRVLDVSPTEVAAASGTEQSAPGAFVKTLPWLVVLWGIGVAFFGTRLITSWSEVRRWRNGATPLSDSHWPARFLRLQVRMGASAAAQLLESARVTTPIAIGFLKPAVLVPAGFLIGLPAGQIEALLAHELAHIRRHDYLFNLFQNVVEIIFFYHPAVWWVGREMRRERENCCDDMAAEVTGGKLGYAHALAALEETRRSTPPLAAVAADGGSLLERIRRLAGIKERAALAWPVISMLFVTAALLLGIAGCDAGAKNPPEKPPVEKPAEPGPAVDPFGRAPEEKPEKPEPPVGDSFGSGIDPPIPPGRRAEDPLAPGPVPPKRPESPSVDPFGAGIDPPIPPGDPAEDPFAPSPAPPKKPETPSVDPFG